MNRNFKILSVVFCVMLAGAMFAGLGCDEQLSKVDFTVAQDTEEFEVDLDAELAKAIAANLIKGPGDVAWADLPDGTCFPLDAETLRDTFFPQPTDVDLEDSPDGEMVKKYKDSVEAVDIDELKLIVLENTLTFDVPEFQLYIGAFGASKTEMTPVLPTGENAITLKAGAKETFDVEITDELIQELAGNLEESMKFSYTYQSFDDSQEVCKGETLGKIKAMAHIQVTVLAQAADAL